MTSQTPLWTPTHQPVGVSGAAASTKGWAVVATSTGGGR